MLRQKPRKLLIILFPFDLHIQPTSNSYWFISHIPILITSQHLYFNYCSQSLDPHSLELVITRLTLKLKSDHVSPLFSTVQWRVITLVIKSLLLTRWPFKMLHNKSFPSHTLYALSTTILPLFLLEGIKLILVQRLYNCSFFSKKLLSSRSFYSFVLIQKKKKQFKWHFVREGSFDSLTASSFPNPASYPTLFSLCHSWKSEVKSFAIFKKVLM